MKQVMQGMVLRADGPVRWLLLSAPGLCVAVPSVEVECQAVRRESESACVVEASLRSAYRP